METSFITITSYSGFPWDDINLSPLTKDCRGEEYLWVLSQVFDEPSFWQAKFLMFCFFGTNTKMQIFESNPFHLGFLNLFFFYFSSVNKSILAHTQTHVHRLRGEHKKQYLDFSFLILKSVCCRYCEELCKRCHMLKLKLSY